MTKYHLNPKTGEPGVCRAMSSCPFGDLESDHYDSKEEARVAYEKSMALASEPKVYDKWKQGRKLSKRDLLALPLGSIARHRVYLQGVGFTYQDYIKVSQDVWENTVDGGTLRTTYMAGAQGHEQSTFVSTDGRTTEELGEVQPKTRSTPRAKFAIVRVSNVTGKRYQDHTFANLKQAEKKLNELNRHDYLHHSYELEELSV